MSEHFSSISSTQQEAQPAPWDQPVDPVQARYEDLQLQEAKGRKLNRSERKEIKSIRAITQSIMGGLALGIDGISVGIDKDQRVREAVRIGGEFGEDGRFTPLEGSYADAMAKHRDEHPGMNDREIHRHHGIDAAKERNATRQALHDMGVTLDRQMDQDAARRADLQAAHDRLAYARTIEDAAPEKPQHDPFDFSESVPTSTSTKKDPFDFSE